MKAFNFKIIMFEGFLYGFICGSFNLDGISWGSTDSWPTKEMTSRYIV